MKFGLFYKFRDDNDLGELIRFYSKLTHINTLYLFHTDIEELRVAFRNCFRMIDAAGGIVVNETGDFLLIHRLGKWDLPKGKLNKNESFEEAALREVEEECGISGLELGKPLISTYHTYPHKGELALKKTAWFSMKYLGNETPTPQTEEDITEVKWVSLSELPRYLDNTYPAIQDVFTYYGV